MSEQDIPEHWELREFESVVEILDKFREPISSKNREKRIEGLSREDQFPYYGAGGQIGWIDDYIFDEDLILLAEDGATTGYTYRISGKSWVNNHAHVLKAKDEDLTDNFLYYYLKSYDFEPLKTGSTRPKLTQTNMKKVSIPLPPLDEQREIVETIEERLDRVDTLSISIRNIGDLSKKYEDSLLAFLFAGKDDLSSEGPDRIPVEEGLPDKWNIKTFDGVIESSLYGCNPTTGEDIDGVPYLRISDVSEEGGLKYLELPEKAQFEESDNKNKYLLSDGDVVIARSGASSGQSYVYNPDHNKMVYASYLIRFTLDQEIVSKEYIQEYLKSPIYWSQVSAAKKGAAQDNINAGDIKEFIIPVPPLDEQEKIVKQIQSVDMRRVKRAVEDLEELFEEYRNSVLSRAFRQESDDGTQSNDNNLII